MKFVKNKNLAILDIETTGVKAGVNKIIEIYILKIFNEELVDEYYSKFDPQQNIPLFISNLTGIYPWHVENSPLIENEIKKIKNFLEYSILIGHNLKFDLSFLNYELNKKNLKKLNNPTIDTLSLSRALLRTKVKNHKLTTLSKYFKTVNQNDHNSKADVLTTYEVFKHLSSFDEIKCKSNIEEVDRYLNSVDSDLINKFNLNNIPSSHGVYIFSNEQNIKYIGKSNNLKNRINSHLSYSRSFKSNKIVNYSNNIDVISLNNELLSLIVEHRLINKFKPQLNRGGRISTNIYWVKLKSNKYNFEISKVQSSNNTLFQIGPFLSYSKAKNFKFFLEHRLETIKCKRNNSRKSKCDISTLLDTECACLNSFDLKKYTKNLEKKLEIFFRNTDIEVENLKKEIATHAKSQNFEEAQKLKYYLSIFENYLELKNFKDKVFNQDETTIKLLKELQIEISDNKVILKIQIPEENNYLLKNVSENYSIVHFYNELLLILRFIRSKESYTISK